MKNLILILFFFLPFKVLFAQDLYLIYNPDEPVVTKDVSKYLGWNEPVISQLRVDKDPYRSIYFFAYPLFGGYPLQMKKKADTAVQTITMSVLSNYPTKTITELDTEMQPLIEADYSNPLTDSWGRGEIRTISYFAAYEHLYVIELDPDNNQAYIVEVIIDIVR